ncbi:unnamed protein product, partial [Mesorhabditis belari]|uniref:C-type lectin domain-containing protein n=1 Tax=Mesorhabditis belari TaxID=2138241 RepID=A0AAF3EQ82_9BILA
MGVMAVSLFITILLLFHQISPSIQQSDHLDQFTAPIDRDEILSGDRRTLNSKDTVLQIASNSLRSCQRNWNQTQQELVEARGKISGLETEIATERNETKEKDVEMSRLTAKLAQIEANLMEKITETKRKNDDLEAQLRTQKTEVRKGKTKIGELEGKNNALQSKNSDLETQIEFERENKTAEIKKLRAYLNRTMTLVLDPNGWSYLTKTASLYKVIDQEMTFDEAEAYCAGRQGHLVTIQSEEENDFVQKLAKTVHPFHGFWIGLKSKPNDENALEWTDGSSVDFTNWDPKDPDWDTHTYVRFPA